MPKENVDEFLITVIEARHVAPVDKNETSDVFCAVKSSFNKQTFKTKVQKKTVTPKWEQTFNFITSIPEGKIHLSLFNKSGFFFKKAQLLGNVSMDVAEFADGKEHDTWLKLEKEPPKKSKEEGEIHVKIKFTGKPKESKKEKEEKEEKGEKGEKETNKGKDEKKEKKSKGPANLEDKYNVGKIIGRGAFSVVKEATRKADGKRYAVKCISKKLIDKKELVLLEREIEIMKKLQHPNIIQLMEVVDTPDTLFLVLEFAPGGELFDSIVNKGSYSETDAARIIKQILEAIQYVHNHGIAHRDLKPENLLLLESTDGDIIKIADFGLSKDFGEEQLQTSCGTPDYVAPEVLLGEPYDIAVDIWSIGVISYVLLCGFPPFYGDSQKELFENIMSGKYDFPEPEWNDVADEAKDFIEKILVVDPEKRATATECLNHPWIKENTGLKKEMRRLESFSVQKFKEYTKRYKEQNPGAYIPDDDEL